MGIEDFKERVRSLSDRGFDEQMTEECLSNCNADKRRFVSDDRKRRKRLKENAHLEKDDQHRKTQLSIAEEANEIAKDANDIAAHANNLSRRASCRSWFGIGIAILALLLSAVQFFRSGAA